MKIGEYRTGQNQIMWKATNRKQVQTSHSDIIWLLPPQNLVNRDLPTPS